MALGGPALTRTGLLFRSEVPSGTAEPDKKPIFREAIQEDNLEKIAQAPPGRGLSFSGGGRVGRQGFVFIRAGGRPLAFSGMKKCDFLRSYPFSWPGKKPHTCGFPFGKALIWLRKIQPSRVVAQPLQG